VWQLAGRAPATTKLVHSKRQQVAAPQTFGVMTHDRLPIRTLVVEDDPMDAFLLQEALNQVSGASFTTTRIESLEDALAQLAATEFDLVLLDLGLPDSRGPETVTRLRRDQPQVPIVVLTGLDDDAVGMRALQLGAQDYLVKGRCPSPLLGRSVRYAIERKRAERAMLAHLKESAIAEERNRMASEIHDTLAQGFVAIIYELEAARELIAGKSGDAAKIIEHAQAIAGASLREARRSVWAFRAPELDGGGLVGAVKCFLDRMAASSSTTVEFSLRGTPYPLPDEAALALLRICQEAVVNALRHAQASKIHVQITYQPSVVDVTVQDDGRGFHSQADRNDNGFGLISMRERAKHIGARIEILGKPGQGTRMTVAARVPKGAH